MSAALLTQEQAEIIDLTKVFLGAQRTTHMEDQMYLFIIGSGLHALKEITPHGEFEALKESAFPSESRSLLGRAMQWASALQHFSERRRISYDGQISQVGYLKMIGNGDLPKEEKQKLCDWIGHVAGGDGVVNLIGRWRSKTAKKIPKPSRLDPDQQMKAAKLAVQMATNQMRSWTQDFPELNIVPRPMLKEFEEARVELGHKVKEVGRRRSEGGGQKP